jgi:hypothetical protein
MRRGVWVVLGLVGMAPVGALAQQEREPPGEQARVPAEVSPEALQQQITELWQGFRHLQGEVAQLREQLGDRPQAPAVGGSGQAGRAPEVGGSGQAGAAQAGAGTGEAVDDTSRAIIVELPATGERGANEQAAGQAGASRPSPGPATGGSGMSPSPSSQAGAANQEVFQGTLRSVSGDRLRMLDGTGRVYEFGLGEQARILGPDGAALSRQALREGMVVRTVTQPGDIQNEVVSVQVFGQVPVPSP